MKKLILVVNFGSSSLKYGIFEGLREVLRGGIAIKTKEHKVNGMRVEKPIRGITPGLLFETVIDALNANNISGSNIAAVAHRVVHGGTQFVAPTVLNAEVLAELEKLNDLAPLHNPVNIEGIKAAMKVFPVKHVAIFDTAFHSSLPNYAYTYGIPYSYTKKGERRYGFHGNSHWYLKDIATDYSGDDNVNLIIIHAGNGISICCVKGGKSVDISMGLTPYAGPIMGTRPGDLDPGLIIHLIKTYNLSIKDLEKILNKGCGLKGISGVSSSYKDVEEAAMEGNSRCQLALDVLYYQVKKYIGAYLAVLEYNVDAIIFSGGIGENSANFRSAVFAGFEKIGIKISANKNQTASGKDFADIRYNKDQGIPILVIKTNEELKMVEQALTVL